jgi:Zn-dependent peptidase ImmA (M78 family)
VDPWNVADRLTVRVVLSDLGASMWGVTLDKDCVVVSSRLSGAERRYALAHELAHVLGRRTAGLQDAGGWREERFADAFAREMLLPGAEVRDAARDARRLPVARLAERYGVHEGTVLLQAAAVGLAPVVQRTPTGAVLCAHCGHRAHVPGCPCRAARAARREPATRLAVDDTLGGGPGWRTTCW